jgi:predicted negative regulator of RcsB-dependent stress response
LHRFVFPAILAAALAAQGAPAEPGQLDASPTLFTVMAAMNAAGYDADLASPNNHPLRNAVRAEIAKRDVPSLAALKAFFTQHRKANDTEELTQYISFALSAGAPPDFAMKKRDVELPPEVVTLSGLSPLLAAFYKEANIEDLWQRSQPAIEQYLDRYHGPVTNAVMQANAYLRQQSSGVKGWHFQIFIELLAPPNQTQVRSYGADYTVVVTPSPEPRIFDIRHAYLVYLLDPLATRYRETLERKKPLIDHAQRAQALGQIYKDDMLLLTTQSLVKAVEARLDHNPAAVSDALRQGFLLAPYFYESLPEYEKQEASMSLYYGDMVKAIDVVKEDARLSKVEFSKEAPVRTVKVEQPAPLSGAAKSLDEAEGLYKQQDFAGAKKLFLDVLQQTDQKPMHAAAYYGLARIAVRQKDPETGQKLFEKTLQLEPEPFVKAWSLVFLGRLSQAAGEREQALKQYQDALQVQGASEEARKAAEQGVQQNSKP